MTTKTRVPNRLANEKSPYLLQHAHNPVDWYPWGEEAFTKAKAEDKPIFLSIGYSTCHWCHVMEKESFEDEEVGELLNKGYVAIKVDREERPDVDHLYMSFCQALTGHGGWPLTIIMTPDKNPFFAGTYFPKMGRQGLPGVKEILENISEIWNKQRQEILRSGEDITSSLLRGLQSTPGELEPKILETAYKALIRHFDNIYGGFGGAPKFPTPHNLTFLLRYYAVQGESKALEIVEKTLLQMYKGGIFDHIGFGFSRYSTDRKWLVPHFEKMLYDNALLAMAYLEAYQVTGKSLYREVAEKIFHYVLRDMTSPQGGFYSAEDADSEGVEGKFYIWNPEQVEGVLGREAAGIFNKIYDITGKGNFEGASIPNLIEIDLEAISPEAASFVEECRQALFKYREERIHPYKDDKILTAWNGLMIAALAMGGRILKEEKYLDAAEKALDFILNNLRRKDGRLLARYRDGDSAYLAYLDDYAFLVWSLLELYQSTYKPQYLKKALALTDDMLEYFWDREKGGFFMTGEGGEKLLARPKEIYDGALPSGNSAAAMNLLRLAALTGDYRLEEKARELFKAFGGDIQANPNAYTLLLQAYLFSQGPAREAVIVDDQGTGARAMLDFFRDKFLPHTVSLYVSPQTEDIVGTVPFLKEYRSLDGKPTAYVCQGHACQAPVTDPVVMEKHLN